MGARSVSRRCALLTLALALFCLPARAAELTAEDASTITTRPFPLANRLEFQPEYTDIRAGGNATRLQIRLGVAYHGLFLPGLKVLDFYSYVRLEMYGESLNQSASRAGGLQDWNALLLAVKPFDWGAQVGFGLSSILPTATDPALDQQEFQLGPAAGVTITRGKRLDAERQLHLPAGDNYIAPSQRRVIARL
jgi:hypothetical protein